jgi:hypothetical protein
MHPGWIKPIETIGDQCWVIPLGNSGERERERERERKLDGKKKDAERKREGKSRYLVPCFANNPPRGVD